MRSLGDGIWVAILALLQDDTLSSKITLTNVRGSHLFLSSIQIVVRYTNWNIKSSLSSICHIAGAAETFPIS